MIQALTGKGVRVPDGFATTARAYRQFIRSNNLQDRLREALTKLEKQEQSLAETGRAIRRLFLDGEFPDDVTEAIGSAYGQLVDRFAENRDSRKDVDVAVRSGATAEDLPEASFAGQQESFLNIAGKEELLKPAADVTLLFLPIGPFLIGRRRVLTIWTSPFQSGCRKWSGPTRAARESCFPLTPRRVFRADRRKSDARLQGSQSLLQ